MPSFINIFNKRISDTGVKSKWEKVQSGLLFTPVSITTLIDTEDERFILNGISPIAKGDLIASGIMKYSEDTPGDILCFETDHKKSI